jgi:hypothetical protein
MFGILFPKRALDSIDMRNGKVVDIMGDVLGMP